MTISLIACMDKNRGIGNKGKLLCHLPSDLRYFKHITNNSTCVMGRTTYESILNQLGKPLPNRTNIVITSDYTYSSPYDNVYIYHSIDDVIHDYDEHGEKLPEVYICGGQTLYEQFLPYADRLYLTIIDHEFEADTYFPAISDEWRRVNMIEGTRDENNQYDHHFLVYEKK